ncbi:MAG: hypothetical protein ABF887_00480 [Gluconobacter oxydans]|uniref:hypothetical protein n=1 Tax=Gluconobacter oxydans TaxID=442 RepID=UPI0039EB3AA8
MNAINSWLALDAAHPARLAEGMGVSREAVRLWGAGKRNVALRNVPRMCGITGLSPYDIRPDVFGLNSNGGDISQNTPKLAVAYRRAASKSENAA